MEFQEIINNLKKTFQNIEYLYLTRKTNKKSLIVVLSTHNQKHFMLARSLYNNQQHDLLFLTDPNNTYYFGNDNGKTYEQLLSKILKNYDNKNVYFVGTSMSGYASIRFALMYNANCFCCNPQVDLILSKNYTWKQLTDEINSIHFDTSLSSIIRNRSIDSVIYIMSGHHKLDAINRNVLLDLNFINIKIISHVINSKSHEFFIGRNIDYLYKIIEIISLYRNLNDVDLEYLAPLSEYESNSINENSNTISFSSLKECSYLSRFSIYEKHIYFCDIGKYTHASKLSGIHCIQENDIWKAIHNPNDNLLLNEFNFNNCGISEKDCDVIFSDWSFRNSSKNEIHYLTQNNTLKIYISNIEDKTIYINKKINAKDILQKINSYEYKNVYLSLHARVKTNRGSIYSSLGGYTQSNLWHHSNSNFNDDNPEQRCICTHFFKDLTKEEFIFVRFNLSADLIDKEIEISDLYLTVGFFPICLQNY